MSNPSYGIAVGSDGALWFTRNPGRIGRLVPGPAISESLTPAPNSKPLGIVTGPDGALWFTEYAANEIGRITSNGTLAEYPVPNSQPDFITNGPDGALWFTEDAGGRIGRMTTLGEVREFLVPTTNSRPAYILTGPDGALWFTEYGGNKIGRITTTGTITEYPIPTPNSQPYGITRGRDGALWFAEISGNKIGRITTAGAITEYPVPAPRSQPYAIVSGPDGALWFTEYGGDRLGRISTAGLIDDFPVPTAASQMFAVSAGPEGTLWFTEYNANKIGRAILPNAPTITSVNTAGAGSDIAQNTWIEIKGTNLVSGSTPPAGVIWNDAPEFASGQLPAQLGGVSVSANGKPAYVYFYCSLVTSPACTSDQINVLTPLDDTLGPVQIVVTNGTSSTPPIWASLKTVAPSLLLFSPAGYVVATHADNSLLGPASLYPGFSTPAAPGEPVVLYAVGFGLPAAPLTSGSSSQSGLLPVFPVCQIGGIPAELSFAGLINPGLYQLNLTVPAGVPDGDNPIRCTYRGAATPSGDLLTVQR